MKESISPLSLVLIFCLVVGGIGYITFQARKLILGPVIVVDMPELTQPLRGAVVTIRGTTRNTVRLTLNSRDIFVDTDGVFTEDVALPVGYTVWELSAWDRFGRTRTELVPLVRVE